MCGARGVSDEGGGEDGGRARKTGWVRAARPWGKRGGWRWVTSWGSDEVEAVRVVELDQRQRRATTDDMWGRGERATID